MLCAAHHPCRSITAAKRSLEILFVKLWGSKEFCADSGCAGVGGGGGLVPLSPVLFEGQLYSHTVMQPKLCNFSWVPKDSTGCWRKHSICTRTCFCSTHPSLPIFKGLFLNEKLLFSVPWNTSGITNPCAKPNGLNYPGGQVKSEVRCTPHDRSVMKAAVVSACILAEWRFVNPFFLAAF